MTLEEAIEMLRENLYELPPNTVGYNCGYADAIRDLEQMVEETDNESKR